MKKLLSAFVLVAIFCSCDNKGPTTDGPSIRLPGVVSKKEYWDSHGSGYSYQPRVYATEFEFGGQTSLMKGPNMREQRFWEMFNVGDKVVITCAPVYRNGQFVRYRFLNAEPAPSDIKNQNDTK